MITFTEALISKWEDKIVYIPNGGGKTTSSKKILATLSKKQDRYVNLFTRRSLESLISIGDPKQHEIYFGFDAPKIERRNEIREQLEKASPVAGYVKSAFSVNSATKAKEKSFFCAHSNISNLKSIPLKIRKPVSLAQVDFNDEDITRRLDSVLQVSLYEKAKSILDECSDGKTLAVDWDCNSSIPAEYKDALMDLYMYSVLYKVKTCLLCGHTYRNPSRLKDMMDRHFSSLSFLEEKTISQKVMLVANDIYSLAKRHEILNTLFPTKARNVKKCFRDIRIFVRLCDLTLYYMSKLLRNKAVDEETTIDDLAEELNRLEKQITSHASNKKHVRRFNEYLIKELKKIVSFPSNNIVVEPLVDSFGITFRLDGKKIDPAVVLSESEMKRLALVALKAEIYFGKTNTLILDDPIDSYDDYNKLVCIKYITSMTKMTKRLKSLFILSNDFETVFRLSEECKRNVIFYLPDFDTSLGGRGVDKYLEVECDSKDIGVISKNEIFYFAKLVGEKPVCSFNYEMMTLALALSCRNISTEIIKKLTRLTIDSGRGSAFAKDVDWENDVKIRIVRNLEHYLPAYVDTASNSYSVTFGEVCDCFARLAKTPKAFTAMNAHDSRLFWDMRLNYSTSPFAMATNGYGTVLDYVSKKIIIVSHAKFVLEKKLVDMVETTYGQHSARLVVNAMTLGGKIRAARNIDVAHGLSLQQRLNKFEKIHEKYSTLYNLFDHGLIQQISPYLPASNIDIKNFYNDVANL